MNLFLFIYLVTCISIHAYAFINIINWCSVKITYYIMIFDVDIFHITHQNNGLWW